MIFHDRTGVKTRIEVEGHIIRVCVALQQVQFESAGTLRDESSNENAGARSDATRLNGWDTATLNMQRENPVKDKVK